MRTKAVLEPERNIKENPVLSDDPPAIPHKWAITCESCGRTCYVNDEEHREIVLAIEANCEDLFRCEICTADVTDWPSKIAASQRPGHVL